MYTNYNQSVYIFLFVWYHTNMTNSEECRSIVEKVFKQNGIEWKVKDFENYIDPKCKTANSIYDKL